MLNEVSYKSFFTEIINSHQNLMNGVSMNKISKISAIVAMSCSFISNPSFAVPNFNNETTATADIVFTAPTNPVTLTITPEANLTAGLVLRNTKVATISAVPASPAVVGVRFTPSTTNMGVSPAQPNFADVTGSNGGGVLSVNLMGDVDGYALTEVAVGTDTYLLDDVNNGATAFNGSLVTYVNADQDIEVDTYTVSLDAAIYSM